MNYGTFVDLMNNLSLVGFGFNVLSDWREPHRKQSFLYCGDPAKFLNRARRYSAEVALLHDYGLWDFTILVRKTVE